MSGHGWFRARAALYGALTANALKPLPGFRAGVPAFMAGGLVKELAPQWLALITADASAQLLSRRRVSGGPDRIGLGLIAGAAAGLGWLIRQSRGDQAVAEQALQDALGTGYAQQLEHAPTPAELATPWREVLTPIRSMRRSGRAIRIERNIAYGEAGARNFLDVFMPADATVQNAPVLLQVHGGAWMYGSKDQQGIPLMHHLAARGWVCVAINYRLAPRDRWPAQVIDVKRAVAWIHEHVAAYGGDPDYLAITGGSAGGHLTALTALTPGDPAFQPGFEEADTSVQVAVPHYGVYDLAAATQTRAALQLRDLFLGRRIFPRPFADDAEAFTRASPMLRITADAPDFFVVHGGNDSLVPVDQARQFVRRLRETSRRTVVYAELPGAQHAFDVLPSIRSAHVVRAIDRYLHWHWGRYRAERSAAGA